MSDDPKPAEAQRIVLTVDRQGNVTNKDELPPELLAQLSTPETMARIQEMYRSAHPRGGRRELRKVLEEERRRRADGKPNEQRCFSAIKPPGMSNKEFAKVRRSTLRAYTKRTLKMQKMDRRQNAGTTGRSAGSEQDSGNSAKPGEQLGDHAAQSAG